MPVEIGKILVSGEVPESPEKRYILEISPLLILTLYSNFQIQLIIIKKNEIKAILELGSSTCSFSLLIIASTTGKFLESLGSSLSS